MSMLSRALVVAAAILATLQVHTPRAQPVPVVSDTLLDFGSVPYPQTATRGFIVANEGDSLLIAKVTTDNPKFQADPLAFALEGGDSQTVTIAYSPATLGFDSTTIDVVTLYGIFDTLQVAARGEGIRNRPHIVVSTDTVTTTVTRGTTAVETLTVTNIGGQTLSWVVTQHPDVWWLTVVPDHGSEQWLDSTDVVLNFDFTSRPAGTYTTELLVYSNDDDNPYTWVHVEANVEAWPNIGVAPASFAFGTVSRYIPVSGMLYVSNTGTADLVVNTITVTTSDLDISPSLALVPGGYRQAFKFILVAQSTGPLDAAIIIPSNDPAAPATRVPVSATVVEPPQIVLATDTIAVAMSPGDSVTRAVTVGNAGEFPLSWHVQRGASWFDLAPASGVVESGESVSVEFRFDSGLPVGVYTSNVLFDSNDPVSLSLRVPVRLELVDSVATGGDDVPEATVLHPGAPNPFNPATTIAFDLHRRADVRLEVYDISGVRVRTLVAREFPAGRYRARWDGTAEDGRPAPSGVYFCRLQAGRVTRTRKIVLLK